MAFPARHLSLWLVRMWNSKGRKWVKALKNKADTGAVQCLELERFNELFPGITVKLSMLISVLPSCHDETFCVPVCIMIC